MSGVAGIIQFDGASVMVGLIESMTSAMGRRGPDGIAHWRKGPVALGQCMLRTTPESVEETQPLASEDESLVLVMDGRVDNSEELRQALLVHGAVLRDRSDAELVIRAYDVWGEECPNWIIGEFVFLVWDAKRRCLFGARDVAGTRHFYYHFGKGWIGVASEIAGLLALGRISPELNESRLLDYLLMEFDRDDEVGTFYQGICRLPAGHAMRVTEQGVKTWRYWNPGDLPAIRFTSLDECAEAFLEQLRIAVKCRLRTLGTVGAMLSGGLDSSSIVGLIDKEFRGELKQPLKTFSLIREDRENCADWWSIQEMLNDELFDSTILTSGIAASMSDSYLDTIKDLNEPFALSHGLPYTFAYEAARRKGCSVILDGMAGDLLFYSPGRSLDCILHRKMFSQIPAVLSAHRRHGLGSGVKTLALQFLHANTPETILAVYRMLRDRWKRGGENSQELQGALLKGLYKDTVKQYLASKHAQRQQAQSKLKLGNDQDAHARIFTSGTLSFAHEVYGQISLSNAVEPRSPFSDRRMIEFAIQMPLEAKLSSSWYKFLLRNAMAGILPEKVRWRRAVGGHPGWKFFEQLVSETARTKPEVWNCSRLSHALIPWVAGSSVNEMWDAHRIDENYVSGYNLLRFLVLSEWIAKRGFRCER